ncbi:hypothetical protein HZB89_01300 [archaeon]|nr:hypothetical protein [archaeon]
MTSATEASASRARHSGGQLSLEFLLVLAGFATAFLLLVPLMNASFELGIYSLDVMQARNFLSSLENALQKNALFDSEAVVSAKPSLEWVFEAKNSTAFIEVKSGRLGKSKTLSITLPFGLIYGKAVFSKKISFKVKNKGLMIDN